MPRMVRKQIYIEEQHDRQLRRIAESRGVSQAEIVRRAIEQEAFGSSPGVGPDASAWQSALAFMRALHREGSRMRRRRRWERDELYEERLRRRGPRTD